MTTGKTIALTRQTFVGKVMPLLFNMLSWLVITFLPRIKRLLISWLQSPSAVILEPKKIKSATVSTVSPFISHEVMGPDAMILVFWWWTGRPGMLQFMGLQRVGHDWATELNWKSPLKPEGNFVILARENILRSPYHSPASLAPSLWPYDVSSALSVGKRDVNQLQAWPLMSSLVVVFQLLSRVWLFVTLWTVARQASLSITISQSLLKFMSIELVMPPNHLILCCTPLLLPSIFPSIFESDGQSIGVSASASVLSLNIQGWLLLEFTGLISL